MKTVNIPWKAWYGNEQFSLGFPEEWEVVEAGMKPAPNISDAALREAIAKPIGTPPLAELARGKKTAAIAIDDLTRPTETYRMLPIIFEELKKAGIGSENIVIIVSLGAHRPLTREDLLKKVGADILENYRIYSHLCFENLVYLGDTERGTPVHANRMYVEADLKIGVSFITPHPMAGFGGGGKIILPGLCGIDTLETNHRPSTTGKAGGLGRMDDNDLRLDIEDTARKVGLAFSVNAVGTADGKTAGVFAGDLVEAHRAAVEQAKEIYGTKVPDDIDVGVFNAYPKDTEFLQCSNALNIWVDAERDLVKKGGAIVITTAASEGRGVHFLGDVGMRMYKRMDELPPYAKKFAGREVLVFSPNVATWEVHDFFPPSALHFKEWAPLVDHLQKSQGAGTRAAVFPCSTLQFEV